MWQRTSVVFPGILFGPLDIWTSGHFWPFVSYDRSSYAIINYFYLDNTLGSLWSELLSWSWSSMLWQWLTQPKTDDWNNLLTFKNGLPMHPILRNSPPTTIAIAIFITVSVAFVTNITNILSMYSSNVAPIWIIENLGPVHQWPSMSELFSSSQSTLTYLHFVLLFWNQVFTWASVIFRFFAIWALDASYFKILAFVFLLFYSKLKLTSQYLPGTSVCEIAFLTHKFVTWVIII